MSLGVYITFRISNFPDLTVDGATTGGGVAAVMIIQGFDPWLATAAAFAGGLLAGACTGLLHTKGKINGLLSGILMMIALHSINNRIMGTPNVSLFRIDTIFPSVNDLNANPSLKSITFILILLSIVLIKLLLDWFLNTDLGLALRATGDNDRMIRSFGANTIRRKFSASACRTASWHCPARSIAQSMGFADSSYGCGHDRDRA